MPGREGRRKPVARQSSFRTVALLMLVPIAAFAGLIAYRYFRDQIIPAPAPSKPVQRVAMMPSPRATPPAQKLAPETPAGEKSAGVPPVVPETHGSDIVLILDDVGFDHQPLAGAMKIDPNLNFSILPNATNAAAFAEELHGAGFQVLCHLPMEPMDYPRESPGPNAIMTSMDDARIAALTREDIAAVPHAAGVNNHMGSRASRDARVMTAMLRALPRGMFFIDSRTAPGSVGERLARELKIPTASRRVFLDDVQSEAAVRRQLASLAVAAQRDGVAIGIGHMYPVTIKVLSDDVPALREKGYHLVRASEAVR